MYKITIAADDLFLNRRDTTSRSDREMTVPMIFVKRENISKRIDIVNSRIGRAFKRTGLDSIVPLDFDESLIILSEFKESYNLDSSITQDEKYKKEKDIGITERQLRNEYNLLRSYIKSSNKYEVELHKKFSLPAACILFVMTGASLGVLFRKGGFTIAVGLSFGFFLIYYILMIVGEDLADRNIVSPVIGVWSPNAILLIISMYLILHTVKEQAPLRASFSFLKKLLKNSGRPKNNS